MRSALFLLAVSAFAQNWAQFRGSAASGVAGSQHLDLDRLAWKVPVPGLAHSSPIVWGDRVFVTSAISSQAGASFKRGLHGEGDASPDVSVHEWKLFCFDLRSGKLLWDRVAYKGVPKEKRHIKSTYSSSTPGTDGRIVVAYFGSQGIYAYDLNGKALWQSDLGRINAGAHEAPTFEWGTASSPIIHGDLVIVQCDQQNGSFLIALKRTTGEVKWKTMRDELPSWGSPAVIGNELITNASNAIRAYDPATGRELWRLGGSSKITMPTPVGAGGLTIVASGRAPIFAIRPGGEVAWQKERRGPYISTPLSLDGLLYVLDNSGIFDCYELATGVEVYRQRIPHAGSGFNASPVAADGKIYLPSEDGDLFIVQSGRKFELLGKKEIGESLMATPAIANGLMFIRGEHNLFSWGKPAR